MSVRNAPIRQIIDILHAYVAVALARQGDFKAAEAEFKIAYPRMAAIDADRIIAMYRAANPKTTFAPKQVS